MDLDLPFRPLEDPTVASQTSTIELPLRTTGATSATTSLPSPTIPSPSTDTRAADVLSPPSATEPDELCDIQTPQYRSFRTAAFRSHYYKFCRTIDALNPTIYVGRRTMRLLYFRRVQKGWDKSVQGELAQRHLAEHKEYLDAVLVQVYETGGMLELYWLQKEESRGPVSGDEIDVSNSIMAKSTSPSTIPLAGEGGRVSGGGTVLHLDPSSLFDNWKVEQHYNSITYETPRKKKKYCRPQHTRGKTGICTEDSESRYKEKKRRELKDRWTVWEQKRGKERSDWGSP